MERIIEVGDGLFIVLSGHFKFLIGQYTQAYPVDSFYQGSVPDLSLMVVYSRTATVDTNFEPHNGNHIGDVIVFLKLDNTCGACIWFSPLQDKGYYILKSWQGTWGSWHVLP